MPKNSCVYINIKYKTEKILTCFYISLLSWKHGVHLIIMKILVCIKQIPDTNDVKWSKDNNIIREGTISILNPYDVLAIEQAKKFKDAEITLLSMGPNGAIDAIRYGLALGAHKGILLSDRKFAGADTLATAKTLYYAIKNVIKEYDLIITGQFALDGDTAQTPYILANLLNIPNIGYVTDIDEINEDNIVVKTAKENGTYKIKGHYPLLISIIKFNGEKYKPLANDYIKAQDTEIKILNADDIMANEEELGLKGSPTYVSKAYRPENKRVCKFINSSEIFEEIKWAKF